MNTATKQKKRTSLSWTIASFLLSVILSSPSARGQAPPIKSTLPQDLAKTYGFCYGQRLSLAQLRQMFPDLDGAIMMTEMQWNTAFKEAEAGVEARLKAFGSRQWEDARIKMVAQLAPFLKEQNRKVTRETAISFLDVVQQRAKGVIDSPNREMLLASDPKFVRSPELEFSSGYTGTFSSKSHSKAKGVELTIRYPLSWKQLEGDRPNIVKKWVSDGGHGTDIFMVQIRKFPALPTPQEIAEIFSESFAKQMFEDGGKLLSYTTGRLEKLPVGIVHFTQTTKRLELTVVTRGVFYYLVHEDAFIALQFMCYTPGSAEVKEARLKQLEPLIKAIANSLILPTNYK